MADQLPKAIERFQSLLMPIKKYHRHHTTGCEHVPLDGPVLMILSHALATYETFLPAIDIYRERGRVPAGLADDLVFKLPYIGQMARNAQLHPASPQNAEKLLREGHMLFIAPGGMRESLRPSTQKRQIRWGRRKGFIRLAIKTGTPIVLCGCPAADDIFTVYDNPITPRIYDRFKVPLFFMRGIGPTPIPRPIKLTHHIGAPMYPPAYREDSFDADVDLFHAEVSQAMQQLLTERD